MKREELFTKLHDQYNTFPSSIQDPEAFHHDVYEISNTASSTDEFHRLLADRKDQRLRELNDTLESASLEIIANPRLVGTEQWQYALQLFRTKSLDSLVRYFASYLPDDHPWQHSHDDVHTVATASSVSDSVADSDDSLSTNSSKPFFDDDDHVFLTDEPLTIHTSLPASHLPPSPRSMTMCSDSSEVSPIDGAHHDYDDDAVAAHRNYILNTLTPARTLSFSEHESDAMVHSGTISHHDEDDETSQSDDLDTPITSVSDISEDDHAYESRDESITPAVCEDSVEESVEESETPTPRNELPSDSYMHPDLTTKPTMPIHHPSSPLYNQVLHEYVRSSRKSRRDGSPGWSVRRTSPEVGRVQKPLPDPIRIRPKGRRRND
jgi:hypothetical protein